MDIKVGIYKRKSSWGTVKGKAGKGWSWYARWRVEVLQADGSVVLKDRHKSLDTQDRQMADRMRWELQEQLNMAPAAAPSTPRSMGWEKAAELYWQYHLKDLAYNTQASAKNSWKQFWTWAGTVGITHLEQVEPRHVIDYRDASGLAPNTLNNYIIDCGAVVAKLQKLRLYEGPNSFKDVKQLYEPETQRAWLTAAEVVTLLEAAKARSVDMHLYCALGCYAGLRAPSEVLGVRWDWIHWPATAEETGYIRIPKSDEGWRVKDQEARNIPLFPALASILEEHRGLPRAYVVAPFSAGTDPRWRWRGARRGMDAMKDLIPGKHLTSYCMRHTFASQCVATGVDVYKIMRWMGHSDIKMLARYAHLAPADNEIRKLFPQAAAEAR